MHCAFAKLIYVASIGATSNSSSSGGVTTTIIEIPPLGPQAKGDLVDGAISSGLLTSLSDIWNKFDVKLVAQSSGSPSTTDITIATGTDNISLLNDLLNNSIVSRNDLTMDDITKTYDMLVAIGLNTDILNLSVYNIINYNNYGNFIDGSDNPIWSAKLQNNPS
jgi:hypothetical protein